MDYATREVLNAPLVDLESFYDRSNMQTLDKVTGQLWAVVGKATRIAAYLEGRWFFYLDHAGAVKRSNEKVEKVRRAIGYSQAKQDLYF